jgi:hypothetical protein
MSAASAKPAGQMGQAPADVAGIVGLIDRLEKLLNASELTLNGHATARTGAQRRCGTADRAVLRLSVAGF